MSIWRVRAARALHPSELPCERDAVGRVLRLVSHRADAPREVRPVHLLVLAPNHAPDIQAPGVGIRVVAQGRERNRKLRRPTTLVTASGDLPDPIPLTVEVASLRLKPTGRYEHRLDWSRRSRRFVGRRKYRALVQQNRPGGAPRLAPSPSQQDRETRRSNARRHRARSRSQPLETLYAPSPARRRSALAG